MTKKEEVELFLQKIRDKLLIFNIVFRPRSKNIEALAELDILPIDRINISNNFQVTIIILDQIMIHMITQNLIITNLVLPFKDLRFI